MTQRAALNLTRRQASQLTPKSLILLAQRRISPKIIQGVFSSWGEAKLMSVITMLQLEAKELEMHKTPQSEEKLSRIFALFKTAMNPKITPSEEVRSRLISSMRELAASGDRRIIPVLLEGLKDSSKANRAWCADGIGLLVLVNQHLGKEVMGGLRKMAQEGNPFAKEIYQKVTGTELL